MQPWDFEPDLANPRPDPDTLLGSGVESVLCDPLAPMPLARHVGFTADLHAPYENRVEVDGGASLEADSPRAKRAGGRRVRRS